MSTTPTVAATPASAGSRGWRLLVARLKNVVRRYGLWLVNLPRFSSPVWRHVVNRRAGDHYRAHAAPLTPLQQQAVRDLQEKGIAVLQCADLFSEQAVAEYCALADQYAQQPHNRQKICGQCEPITQDRPKYYALSLWDEGVLDLANPFVKFSLSDEILGIVNGYLQMSARLINVDLWYHRPTTGPHVASQNWHRDPTDRKVLKVFLYLRDVDETSGPFEFISGSHEAGPYGKVFPRKLPLGVYPHADAVDRKFRATQRIQYTGKAGTIVICDTSGLHRGGHVTGRDRYLYYSYFLSDAAYGLDHFFKTYDYRLRSDGDVHLSSCAEYAVEIWKRHTARQTAGQAKARPR